MAQAPKAKYAANSYGSNGRWTATDEEGRPTILFEAEASGGSSPRWLANIIYRPPVLMNLQELAQVRQVSAAALICRTSDRMLHEHFFRLADAIFGGAETVPLSEADIERRLDGFIALLAALRAPGRRAAQGLWSELAMIAWSRDAIRAIEAWHPSPQDLHDFTCGPDCLELKSTSGEGRVHDVGLEQLSEDNGKRVIVASLRVELNDEGTSVGELVERILKRAVSDQERHQKVQRVVYESLGRDWEQGTAVRIAERAAWQSLRFYPAKLVPSVARPVPMEVSRVRFAADLGALKPMGLEPVRALGPWWTDIAPVELNVQ